MPHCEICKCEESSDRGLFEAPFFEDQRICSICWSSDRMKDWVKGHERENPLFKRYMRLISMHSVACQSCHLENYIVPKFVGHSPRWELCCDHCARIDIGLNPYQEDLTILFEIYGRFQRLGEPLESLIALVRSSTLASISKPCECGGNYSVLAQPRCNRCSKVLFESIFHYSEPVT